MPANDPSDPPSPPPRSARTPGNAPAGIREGFPIVGIGASAGGLEAAQAFFKAVPGKSGMAFVLVVHLDPDRESDLANLLRKSTAMPVVQIEDNTLVEVNRVYVIPPGRDLTIVDGALKLVPRAVSRGHALPIDRFFRSLAQDQRSNAIVVILSGSGSDGALGLGMVKGEGGMVMVQSEESAKYSGMPRSAIRTGLADFVLPAEQLPQQLLRYTSNMAAAKGSQLPYYDAELLAALQEIFTILRTHTGHDFSLYKPNAICRRIERRMNIHQIDAVADYVRYLRESDREAGILFKELLIGVTSFFRDPESFEVLARVVFPELLAGKADGATVRVWLPGCSTGEEAYSVAIVLFESLESLESRVNVQMFGTDIDEDSVDISRAGLYPASIQADVEKTRFERFFSKENDDKYRISKQIREMLVFAPQSVIKDPPFTRMDLVVCRNLLIYLGAELQKRLLQLFHYSLRPNGFLFLGSSETIGERRDLFDAVDKKWKIFRALPNGSRPTAVDLPGRFDDETAVRSKTSGVVRAAEEISALRLVETILRQSDMPPCVVVDAAGNVIYVHGRTGRFLEPAEGRATTNVVEMARVGLRTSLAGALRQVSASKRENVDRAVKVQLDGAHILVDLIVRPILEQTALRGLMLVLFQEVEPSSSPSRAPVATMRSAADIQDELDNARERLQSTVEKLEASNEELRSANEELQSTNEELQSTNEELETSKEELQSLNEESVTVNAELQARIDDLAKSSDDMRNLLDSTDVATVFLDAECRVRRFTPKATDIVPLRGLDIGRHIGDFATSLIDVRLSSCAKDVLDDLIVRQLEVKSVDGRVYRLRVRPYRTVNNVIDGVVMTFEDTSDLESALSDAESARAVLQGVVDTIRDPLLVLRADLTVETAGRAFYERFGARPEETEGRFLYELGDGQWQIPALRELLNDILPRDGSFEGFKIEHEFVGIGRRKLVLDARKIHGTMNEELILLVVVEINELD